MTSDRVTILGMPVDRTSRAAVRAAFAEFLKGDVPRFVITADAAGMAQATEDPDHRALFDVADLITPDSVGVLWAAKRKGLPIGGRVSGVDLVEDLSAELAKIGGSLYLLGAAPGVAAAAAERLVARHPGLKIAGVRDGFFRPEDEPALVAEIAATKPDGLLVAMGIPRQEKFIARHRDTIRAKVSMGVGGSFDVISGTVKRAPVPVQKLHLEWVWRTLANPKKIAKAKWLPVFVFRVLKER